MVKAYVLIEMLAGYSEKLASKLKGREVVHGLDRVTGPYDVIAVVEAEDINGVSEVVSNEIHSQPGVVRTTTCVSMK